MLVQEAVVLFVDADGILDDSSFALGGGHDSVHVVDSTLAVTAQLERVGHQAGAILADVESVLLVVRLLGAAVGNDHLDDGDTVEQGALAVFVHVVGADVGDDNTLAIVEADVHLVVGPEELVAADLEGHTLGLGDVDGLQAVVVVLVTNEFREVVVLFERHGSALAIHVADINAEDFFGLGVGHDGKVQGMGVLVVKLGGPVVSETLLKTALEAPALVDTDGPGIQEDLGHVGDADLLAGANDTGVIAGNALHHVEIFQSEGGHDIMHLLPLLDLGLGQVDDHLCDFLCLTLDDDGKRATVRSGHLSLLERCVLGLPGLAQSDAVELDGLGAGIFANQGGSLGDLLDGKLI